jgi:hypothetical protein
LQGGGHEEAPMRIETVRSRPLALTQTCLVAPTHHTPTAVERIEARRTMAWEQITPGDAWAQPGKDNR